MLKHCSALIPLIASLFLSACNSNVHAVYGGVLDPTPTPFGGPIVKLTPQTAPIFTVPGFGCPLVQPFRTNFNVVVDAQSSADVFLNAVTFRFIDGSTPGQSPLVSIFSPTELTSQFGQTRIASGAVRAFAFSPQFGCGFGTPKTLVADITLRGANGSMQQFSLTMPMQ